jgi:hypothetical protein
MKKEIFAILTLGALLTSLIVMAHFVDTVKANMYIKGPYPYIEIESPKSKAYNQSNISLFVHVGTANYSDSNGKRTIEFIKWLNYSVDEETNNTVDWFGPYNSFIGADGATYYSLPYVFGANSTLLNLSDGTHLLRVYGETTFNSHISANISFTVYTESPQIQFLSAENKTYNTGNITLDFTTNHSVNWISYSLDNQANTTISGNSTLADLPEGAHNIIVYANDTAGNMGKSDMVFFAVDTSPRPSLTISSSPAQQPTSTQISPNPTLLNGPTVNFLLALTITVAIVAIIGLGTYFKQRKKKTAN